ncbi:MAG: caspase family protein [Gammaproteobacteria bacterium]|nr:caspase family protein [Gammaproteobacteria bacterium]
MKLSFFFQREGLGIGLCFMVLAMIALTCEASNASTACRFERTSESAHFILAMGANTDKVSQANKDAEDFAKAMRERFTIPPRQVCILADVERQMFIKTLERLQKIVKSRDKVIIYFSGHGTFLTDNNLDDEEDCVDEALVMVYRNDPEVESIRDDHFVRLVNKIRTDDISIFLDTCFAGGLRRGIGACHKTKDKFLVKGNAGTALPGNCPVKKGLSRLKGTLYAASKEDQSAWEIRGQGGRFTWTFLNFMKKHPGEGLDRIFERTKKRISTDTKDTSCYQEPQRYKR